MTEIATRRVAEAPEHRPVDRPLIDLSAVAAESPAESIAHENEIVEHIALEHDIPDQPAEPAVAEQLRGLVDPARIRATEQHH